MVYRNLREHYDTLPWKNAIWITRGIPKHSFTAWLFALNRNPTRDRLQNWGVLIDIECLFVLIKWKVETIFILSVLTLGINGGLLQLALDLISFDHGLVIYHRCTISQKILSEKGSSSCIGRLQSTGVGWREIQGFTSKHIKRQLHWFLWLSLRDSKPVTSFSLMRIWLQAIKRDALTIVFWNQ